MIRYDTVTCALDLDAAGKSAGWVELTHSDNDWDNSAIRSPLGVIRGGDGPVALVTGGNHGDEYEGQIIVRRLFEMLEPADVPGALILMPALNMPAVLAARRVSPLDSGNMNRSFPGAEGAGPTRALAGFVTTHLIARAGLVIDLHSGGTNSDFIDCGYLTLTGDAGMNRRNRALAETFGLPWTVVTPPGNTGGDLDSAAHAAGCAMFSCELGGAGQVSRVSLDAGWQGVLRLLASEGVIAADAARRLGAGGAGKTRFADLGAGSRHVTAMRHALAEPLVALGQDVAMGQPVAILRDLHDLDLPAQELTAPVAGVVLVARCRPLVRPGDHLFTIGPELDAKTVAEMAG